jgi:hypothetical protein
MVSLYCGIEVKSFLMYWYLSNVLLFHGDDHSTINVNVLIKHDNWSSMVVYCCCQSDTLCQCAGCTLSIQALSSRSPLRSDWKISRRLKSEASSPLGLLCFRFCPPGGQAKYHTGPKFGLWVTLTKWYRCTKFQVNSSSGYKTCHAKWRWSS